MIEKNSSAVLSPPGPRWGRRLAGVVALSAATILAGAGCSGSDGGGSDGSKELSPSEFALCEMNEVLTVSNGSSFEQVLTGDDKDDADALLAIGLFVEVREDVVVDLGEYDAGAQAIQRRNEQHIALTEKADVGAEVPFPDAEPTEEELASVRAADEFIVDGGCGPVDTEEAAS